MRDLAGFAEICSMEIYVAFRRRDARATGARASRLRDMGQQASRLRKATESMTFVKRYDARFGRLCGNM